jgi:serine/threonine protein kinase/ankyrin repeat protein
VSTKYADTSNLLLLTQLDDHIDHGRMPVPFIAMEAAQKSLSEFLADSIDVSKSTQSVDQIKYQLCLDIAAGIGSIHSLNIVHGDLKPDNVLVFENKGKIDVPYIAKLSDFGLCIDLQPINTSITPELYKGTPVWTGPETRRPYRIDLCGTFEPQHFKHFDAFSYGLILTSVFTLDGEPLNDKNSLDAIRTQPNADYIVVSVDDQRMVASEILLDHQRQICTEGTRPIVNKLRSLVPRLLDCRPADRPLPTADLLRPFGSAPSGWTSWKKDVDLSQCDAEASDLGPLATHGPSYWFRMDAELLYELHRQNSELEDTTQVSAATLFGLGLRYSKPESSRQHVDLSLDYMHRAACTGYLPAQAIFANIFAALKRSDSEEPQSLATWCSNAVEDGAIFGFGTRLTEPEMERASSNFRAAGGYNNDPFLSDQKLCDDVRHSAPTAFAVGIISTVIDSARNRAIHAAAALGSLTTIESLLATQQEQIECLNDKGETPLLKACAAGQTETVELLCARGARAHVHNHEGVSALHWLFAFPTHDIPRVARALHQAGAALNHSIPTTLPSRNGSPNHLPWRHFPFEWPLGTAMHWAAFSSNRTAVETLVALGCNVDAVYKPGEAFTTPLAQAVYRGDAAMVTSLIKLGANAMQTDAKGRTLLHALSFGTNSGQESRRLQQWVFHGTAENHLGALQRIIKCLVARGVSLEQRSNAYGNLTALQQAIDTGYFDAHIVQALCLEGADCNVADNGGRIVLHALVLSHMFSWSWPQTRNAVMRIAIERTSDVRARTSIDTGGHNALHMLATAMGFAEEQFEIDSQLLLDTPLKEDINQQSKEGFTPLCYALLCRTESIRYGRQFVSFGASALPSNAKGRNVIDAIVSNLHLMDKDTSEAIRYYVDRACNEGMSVKQFVSQISLETLHRACNDGRPLTVQTLLDLGMQSRINEFCGGLTALENTFQKASRVRAVYLYHASNYYRAPSFLATAEQSGFLYGADHIGSSLMTHNTSPAARLREAYWSYPQVLSLLQSAGGRRGRAENVEYEIKYEPRWVDEVEFCAYSIDAALQPHSRLWQILYDLQDLPPDFDDQASEYIRWFHDDPEDRVVPTVLTLQKWPLLSSVLRPVELDWYAAVWYDGCRVEAKLEDGRVTKLRNITSKGHQHNLANVPVLDWTLATCLTSYVPV